MNINKETLNRMYVEKTLAITSIATLLRVPPETVAEKLIEYDLPIRNRMRVLARYKSLTPSKFNPISMSTGFRRRIVNGYVQIDANDGWVMEHRFVWEQTHGLIPRGWIVHHINGIKDDNRLENLIALSRNKHSTQVLQDTLRLRVLSLEEEVKGLKVTVEVYEEAIRA